MRRTLLVTTVAGLALTAGLIAPAFAEKTTTTPPASDVAVAHYTSRHVVGITVYNEIDQGAQIAVFGSYTNLDRGTYSTVAYLNVNCNNAPGESFTVGTFSPNGAGVATLNRTIDNPNDLATEDIENIQSIALRQINRHGGSQLACVTPAIGVRIANPGGAGQ